MYNAMLGYFCILQCSIRSEPQADQDLHCFFQMYLELCGFID